MPVTLEVGEYFIITRGLKLNISFGGNPFEELFGFNPFSNGQTSTNIGTSNSVRSEAQYDRSYHDHVFKALAISGPNNEIVAAECVWQENPSSWYNNIGKKFQFRLYEIEIWPVTQQYVDALSKKEK